MGKTVPIDPQRKAEALRLEAEFGSAEASRRTGIRASTIRMWKARGEGARTTDLAEVSTDQIRNRIRELEKTADLGIKELQATMRQGSRSPQSLAISIGIVLDKASQLAAAMRELEDREVRLAQDQAQLINVILGHALEALGIPTDPLRSVMRQLLEQATTGGPYFVSPAVAQQAYADIRQHFERIAGAERRQLPAGELAEPDEVSPENFADGVEVKAAEGEGEEVTDAEVVVDERSIEQKAKALADRVIARMAAEEAEPEFGVGHHARRAGAFDISDPASSTVRYGPQRWGA